MQSLKQDPRQVDLKLHTDYMVDEAKWIMGMYDLSAFESYLTHSTSVDLPYHNKYHTSCMIRECERLAVQCGLQREYTRLLLTAAAFHDFNHSGGKQKDDENIRLAIEAFRTYTDLISETDRKTVEDVIRVTQYPFVREPEDFVESVTKMMKIIRDCDLMQSFRPTWFVHVVLGLRAESFPEADIRELVKKNYEFVSSQSFYIVDPREINRKILFLEENTEHYLRLTT